MIQVFRSCRPPGGVWRCILIAFAAFGLATSAHGETVVDLTTLSASPGTINGAVFALSAIHTAGAGVVDPFLVMCGGTAGGCAGFNTSAASVDPGFEINLGQTSSLLLSSLAVTTIDNVSYYAFLLNTNERGQEQALVSLDTVQVYQTSQPAQTGTPFVSADLVYNMDAGAGGVVLLNNDLGAGLGTANMYMYVPTGAFDGTSGDYVLLYAAFGGYTDPAGTTARNWLEDDGSEEWAVIGTGDQGDNPVPEPATLLLMGSGLLAFGVYRRRR